MVVTLALIFCHEISNTSLISDWIDHYHVPSFPLPSTHALRVLSLLLANLYMGEIDWEHPGIYRGNLITCAGSERVTDRVCSIK